MRQAGGWLFGLLFALVLFLGAQALVEGPVQENLAAPPSLPIADTCLAAAMRDADMPSGVCIAAQEENACRYAAAANARETLPAVSLQCESNGWPLTSRSWARTVYPACPPEDQVG